MLSDIEIAQRATLRPIVEPGPRSTADSGDELEPYGRYKAKLSLAHIASLADRPDGKLILMSGISPTPAGEGKSTTTVGLGRRAQPYRQERDRLPARAVDRPGVRHEGGRCRRRLRAGRADGGHQPAFHRRLQRHRARPQPARCADRQPHPSRQRARLRSAPHHLAPRGGHERPRVARHHGRAWRSRPTAIRGRMASTSSSPPRSWRSCAWPTTSPI